MLFTITYRKEYETGGYWGNDKTTVKVYGSNIEEARDKINKIDPCAKFGVYNRILHWDAIEILGGDVDDE